MAKNVGGVAALSLCVLIGFEVAAEDLLGDVQQSVKSFAPVSAELSGGKIKIAFPVDQVSEQMYSTLSKEICYIQWSGKGDFSQVNEVLLLNRSSWQGWVLETPSTSCDKLGKANSDQYPGALMDVSHMASQGK